MRSMVRWVHLWIQEVDMRMEGDVDDEEVGGL